MAENGVRLDEATISRMASENRRQNFWHRAALWLIAGALAALAALQINERLF